MIISLKQAQEKAKTAPAIGSKVRLYGGGETASTVLVTVKYLLQQLKEKKLTSLVLGEEILVFSRKLDRYCLKKLPEELK